MIGQADGVLLQGRALVLLIAAELVTQTHLMSSPEFAAVRAKLMRPRG